MPRSGVNSYKKTRFSPSGQSVNEGVLPLVTAQLTLTQVLFLTVLETSMPAGKRSNLFWRSGSLLCILQYSIKSDDQCYDL